MTKRTWKQIIFKTQLNLLCCGLLYYAGGRGAANVGNMSTGRGGMPGIRGMGPARASGGRGGGGFSQSGQSHVAQHTSA